MSNKCKHGIRDIETNIPYCRSCDNEINKSPAAIRFAAGEVDKLAAHLIGNTKTDGTRDSLVYEQGIGCERAAKMLREMASIIDRQDASP